jgi:RNA polymerase sigma-B factor
MSGIAFATRARSSVNRAGDADRSQSREMERQLLVLYHRDGDLTAREELLKRFDPLARDLAMRYSYTDEPIDDLFQVARLGLIKALDRYQPDRGTKFTSYAAPTILGEIKRHFRDKGWAVRVPRPLQERALALSTRMEELSKSLGRAPKVREVAASLGWAVEEVLETQDAATSYEAASLDAPVARDDGDAATLVDLLGRVDVGYELVESRDAIGATWSALPDIEREVLELRFIHDLTQREIGERVGYSQMHISRLLRRALDELEQGAAA